MSREGFVTEPCSGDMESNAVVLLKHRGAGNKAKPTGTGLGDHWKPLISSRGTGRQGARGVTESGFCFIGLAIASVVSTNREGCRQVLP